VDAIDYCHSIVRSHDKDRYLASLFAPDEKRPQLWALYAFNYEIARIRELVSEPASGEVRLQWWLEAVNGLFAGSIVDHPVAQRLAVAIEHGVLPKAAFVNLIEARRFDLYDDPMPSLADLEGYLGETSSSIVQLASLILAGPASAKAASAAGYAGVAYGLTGLVRALPLHRARGQCYVPNDLLEREGLTPAHLIGGKREPAMLRVMQQLTSIAEKRLAEARALRGDIPAHALAAFLPAALVDAYLATISRAGLDALSEVAQVAQWRRQLRLWRMARRGEF
jgi:15-cis-phytoene synthase